MSGNDSFGTPLKSRLLPRISFRSLFALTLVSAVVAAVARAAGGGNALAFGFISAIAFAALVVVSLAVVFLLSWMIASIGYTSDATSQASPFAEDQLPPQILPPRDPVT